jgi:peptidoglycan/LPS O-acetylase OafA/YrhL
VRLTQVEWALARISRNRRASAGRPLTTVIECNGYIGEIFRGRYLIMTDQIGNADQTKKWLKEVDFLRGIAILAVLVIHTSWNSTMVNTSSALGIFNVVITIFSRFAIPLFIFVSGMVLSRKYYYKLNKRDFYFKRLRSIIPEYIIFSAFYMLCEIAYSGEIPSLNETIIKWLTGGYAYLWFLVLILQLYILFPFIIGMYSRYNKKADYLLIIAFVIELAWASVDINVPKDVLFPTGIFYLVLGIYTYDHIFTYNLRSVKSYLVILSIILFSIIVFYPLILDMIKYGSFENIPNKYPVYSIAFSQLLYTAVIILMLNIGIAFRDNNNMLISIIRIFGIYSFGIYLIHFFYRQLITMLLIKIGITFNDISFYAVLFSGMLIFSLATTYIISRLPFGEYIVGVASTRNRFNMHK